MALPKLGALAQDSFSAIQLEESNELRLRAFVQIEFEIDLLSSKMAHFRK